MRFQEAAVESACMYHRYLKKKSKGLMKYGVISIYPDHTKKSGKVFFLVLDQKPKSTDELVVQIGGISYTSEDINPVMFNRDTNELQVILSEKTKDVFKGCSPETVFVYTDLKFLIRNIENWYKNNGDRIKLPGGKSRVQKPDTSSLLNIPSPDQEQAIEGVLSEPFTYVWGAPGTGKTQVVLARAVLAYIQAGKKVLVTAPTNNAVEQMLYGILPVVGQAGFDYNKLIIRLGVSSASFSHDYPGVCEAAGFEKKIAELQKQIESAKLELEKNKKEETQCKQCLQYQSALKKYNDLEAEFFSFIDQLQKIGKRIDAQHDALSEQKQYLIKQEKDTAEQQKNHEFYRQHAQDLLKRFHRPLHAVFSAFSKKREKEDIDSALREARYYEEKTEQLRKEAQGTKSRIEKIEREIQADKESFAGVISAMARRIDLSEKLHSMIVSVGITDYQNHLKSIQEQFQLEKNFYETKSGQRFSDADLSMDVIKNKRQAILDHINLLNKEKNELEQAAPGKKAEDCLVVACTIDKCLARFKPSDTHFEHVFLDEAGYSPLIKAVILTAYCRGKMTFLGDHMQLPPVCEVSREEIQQEENGWISFWAQSSLYTESVFSKSAEEICVDYLTMASASFQRMKKYDLIKSYRFGPKLANVLADYVYEHDFSGNAAIETQIYYIDAPRIPPDLPRVSTAEAEAITRLFKKYPVLKNTSGVIAPYKDQVKCLKDRMKKTGFPADQIMTVHGSQGREWDHVFLSVTDAQNMYFMNSTNMKSDGKKIINTAVSRAKKELILVCDYGYWSKKENQFIKKLLDVAKKLEV